ncbi:MAG: helix-turn-helix transcriptional regulator [Pseudomonadota bacterium]
MRGDIFAVLRHVLRARSLTYADLAARLSVSEPTIKRLFAEGDCKLSRLQAICAALDLTLDDVLGRAERIRERASYLPLETEAALAADPSAFHVFLLLRDGIPQHEIAARFGLEGHDLFLLGRRLERLGLVEVMAGSRLRLAVEGLLSFRRHGPLGPLLRALNLRFVAEVIAREDGEATAFVTLSRRMLPDTAARACQELRAVGASIAEMARQDQLVAAEADLITVKLTAACAPVDFTDILTIERPQPRKA